MGEIRNAYRMLDGKPESKRSLGRTTHRWKDNIKMCVDWVHLAQDKDQYRSLMCMVMNLLLSQKAGNFLTTLTANSFLRRTLPHVVIVTTVIVIVIVIIIFIIMNNCNIKLKYSPGMFNIRYIK
jgi:uncharacterized integral membrane protein